MNVPHVNNQSEETPMDPVDQLVETSHALIDSLDFHTSHEKAELISEVVTAIARVESVTPQQLDSKELNQRKHEAAYRQRLDNQPWRDVLSGRTILDSTITNENNLRLTLGDESSVVISRHPTEGVVVEWIPRPPFAELVLSFEPQAIRDHFDVMDIEGANVTEVERWVLNATDEDLVDLGRDCLSSDTVYEAFHRVLEMLINDRVHRV